MRLVSRMRSVYVPIREGVYVLGEAGSPCVESRRSGISFSTGCSWFFAAPKPERTSRALMSTAEGISSMADTTLIDGLVDTYRSMNHDIRNLDEERLRRRAGSGASVREVMYRMRDDELRFSQALKERITGVPIPDLFGGNEMPTLGTETDHDTTAMLIAQFGTARESTLAMLRDLPESDWNSTGGGDKSIRTRAFELLDNDRRQLQRINTLLAAS